MKALLPFLFFSVFLFSCGEQNEIPLESEPTESVSELSGKFIRVADNDKGGLYEQSRLIREIEFKGKYCQFLYVGTPMSGKYEIDKNFVYITTGSELGILALEIINSNRLEGEGYIHGTFKREGTFVKEESSAELKKTEKPPVVAPSQESEKISEDGSKEVAHANSPNSSSEENPFGSPKSSNNPFGSGGGTGDTYGYGSGTDGSGTGTGTGSGPSTSRILVRDVSELNVHTDVDVVIQLKLIIDQDGNVRGAQNLKSGTTTTDQVIINKVINAVKSQVKYNKAPGAGLQKMRHTVRIKAE